jgi:hypothetical protein
MTSSYDVLAAINVERIAGHPMSGGMAQGGDRKHDELTMQGQQPRAIACVRDGPRHPGRAAGLSHETLIPARVRTHEGAQP